MSNTREYIIDEAYNLFLNHSYEAVSISDISKAIGLTKGAMYHHFRNKEDLFKAVIDKYLDIQIKLVDDSILSLTDYINKIVNHSRQVIESIMPAKNKTITLNYLSLYIDAFRHYPDIARKKGNFAVSEIKKIENLIRKAMDSGEIRKDIDPEIVALNFFSLSLGMVADLLHNNSTDQALDLLHKQLTEFYKLIKI